MTDRRPPPIVEARHLTKAFTGEAGHARVVLRDIDLAVEAGEVVCVLGPSGSGKSTLLRLLVGLIPPTSGEVLAHGAVLRGLHPGAAFVFQSFALFPWLTVEENVRVGLLGRGLGGEEEARRVAGAIDLVGLEGFEQAYPKELSGGMKQRVGIARALVARPELLCLDEPFSALDVLTAETLRAEMARIWAEGRAGLTAILMITHSIEEAVMLGDRIVLLETNPGTVRAIIPNTLPHPREAASEAFRSLVQTIHDRIREAVLPDVAPPAAPPAVVPLPNARLGQILGVLRLLAARGGDLDLFALDELTGFEFGRTITITKAAELLGLVDTPRNHVILTPLGREVLTADVNGRKRLLGARLAELPTFRYVLELLDRTPGGRIPLDLLHEEFAMHLPAEPPREAARVLLDWGRYAELLGFDPETQAVYRLRSS